MLVVRAYHVTILILCKDNVSNVFIAVCQIIDISKIYSLKKRLVERIKQQVITNEIMHGFG